jgi:formylglycine-generating enzyme required for sulfatase activity
MGSPMSESGRYDDENLHRRRINRTFAIGMHEITVAQFRRFRRNHGYNRQVSEVDNMPANSITWYEAAEFCNWLSKEEGISQDQWCYSPDQQFASGMRLRANYLELTGYRLPTEAEWEYACRSGTFTARFFGSGDTLLGDYAWYTKNSGDTGMLAVGSQRPNGYGLFGMYGNAFEWCQDASFYFPVGKEFLSDAEQSQALDVVDTTSRVLRGGSFNGSASVMRSADRHYDRPDLRINTVGFRVSRTYPLPP